MQGKEKATKKKRFKNILPQIPRCEEFSNHVNCFVLIIHPRIGELDDVFMS
jgi:hypothetical protein